MLDLYHFIEKNRTFRQFSVDRLLFTAYDCPIEESQLDYWAEKNYFCYIVSGGVKWKTLNDEYVLQVGDAAFIRRGAHRICKVSSGDFCALLIFMPDEFIRSVINDELSRNNFNTLKFRHSDSILPLIVDQRLFDYFKTVLNYFSQSLPPSKSLLKIKFKELIINIITGNHNPELTECFNEICYYDKRALRPIMEKNFQFDLSLEEFAKLCGRSLATFNRDFTKEYNTSPGRWLRRKRIEYGKFLLETSSLNINEIAFEAGFKNTSHFIRVFKEAYQQTPLKFRQSLPKKKILQA